jgi:hypothetical protein
MAPMPIWIVGSCGNSPNTWSAITRLFSSAGAERYSGAGSVASTRASNIDTGTVVRPRVQGSEGSTSAIRTLASRSASSG